MKTKKSMLCIIAILLLATTVYGQVTIGSPEAPIAGALLDLKEKGDTKKGLLLPRVALIDLTTLKPMFTYEDEISTPTDKELKSHKGLLVYNVGKQQRDPCDFTPNYLDLGLHVWDGEKWVVLDNKDVPDEGEELIKIVVRNPDVKIFTDRRRGKQEQYTCRKFGDAIWMTMNLRATEYSENSNVKIALKKGVFAKDVVPTSGAYYFTPYPFYKGENYDSQYIGYDESWMINRKLVGYIYSYEAMTGSSREAMNSDVLIQGLCPDGWHVPRFKEYKALKLHIENNQEKYLVPTSTPTSTLRYADAFIVPCSPYDPKEISKSPDVKLLTGRSLSYSDGGFGDFGLGTVPISNKKNAFSRGSHAWVYYSGPKTGNYDHSVYRISTSTYSPNESEDARPNTNSMFGTGLRCVKNNDQFDFD